MGKPIGNGHPMAAVVTTEEIAASFANGMEYFSTFGGNPVSAEIGLAVLDVIRDERLMHNADVVGEPDDGRSSARWPSAMRSSATCAATGCSSASSWCAIDRPRNPLPRELREVVEAMKARHILLSTEGPRHNVLKIKPPIVFSAANCDEFITALDDVLTALP